MTINHNIDSPSMSERKNVTALNERTRCEVWLRLMYNGLLLGTGHFPK